MIHGRLPWARGVWSAEARALLDRQWPVEPDRPRVTDVRPPSTLRPGECYAILANGDFRRRQLDPAAAP